MSKILRILGILIIPVFLFGTLTAGRMGPKETVTLSFTEADGTSFATEPLNGTPQTSVIEVDGLRFVTLYIFLDRTAATDVQVNCNVGPSTTTVLYAVQSVATVAGVGTHSDYVPTKAVSADDYFPVEISLRGYAYLQCSFTGTAAGADDLMGLTIVGSTD